MRYDALESKRGNKRSENALISAAEAGDETMVKSLLKYGTNIHFVENSELGYNALHFAAYNGHKRIVKLLLRAGADINKLTADNYSALMLAALGGYPDVVRVMLKLKPDLTIATQDANYQTGSGLTCLHLAVLSNSTEVVQLLVQAGADGSALTDMNYNALHLAVELSDYRMVSTVLTLIPALSREYANTTDGAEKTSVSNHNTALHLAVLRGDPEIVQLLLENARVNLRTVNNDGYTPLQVAVYNQNAAIVALLLRHHHQHQQQPHTTPASSIIDQKLNSGHTLLMYAVLEGNEEIVQLLVQYGADKTIANEMDGSTPLIAAVKQSNLAMVHALLKTQYMLRTCSVEGSSDIECALQDGYYMCMNKCTSTDDTVSSATHTDAPAVPSEGLHYDAPDNLLRLMHHTAALCNHVDKAGNTALFYAVQRGNVDIIVSLLTSGADVRGASKTYSSLTVLAEAKGYTSVVHLLKHRERLANVREVRSDESIIEACKAIGGCNNREKLEAGSGDGGKDDRGGFVFPSMTVPPLHSTNSAPPSRTPSVQSMIIVGGSNSMSSDDSVSSASSDVGMSGDSVSGSIASNERSSVRSVVSVDDDYSIVNSAHGSGSGDTSDRQPTSSTPPVVRSTAEHTTTTGFPDMIVPPLLTLHTGVCGGIIDIVTSSPGSSSIDDSQVDPVVQDDTPTFSATTTTTTTINTDATTTSTPIADAPTTTNMRARNAEVIRAKQAAIRAERRASRRQHSSRSSSSSRSQPDMAFPDTSCNSMPDTITATPLTPTTADVRARKRAVIRAKRAAIRAQRIQRRKSKHAEGSTDRVHIPDDGGVSDDASMAGKDSVNRRYHRVGSANDSSDRRTMKSKYGHTHGRVHGRANVRTRGVHRHHKDHHHTQSATHCNKSRKKCISRQYNTTPPTKPTMPISPVSPADTTNSDAVAGRALLALTTHYEVHLQTLTVQYESRIAALQQHIHHLELHHGDGSVVWDEEVHFTSATDSTTLSVHSGTPTKHIRPTPPTTPTTMNNTHSTCSSVPAAHTVASSGTPVLTNTDRFFLECMSGLLLLITIAIMVFIRTRLMQ